MIARLEGLLLEQHPTRVVIDVGGVGYDVHIPQIGRASCRERV